MGADQLRGYCIALVAYTKSRFAHDTAHIFYGANKLFYRAD